MWKVFAKHACSAKILVKTFIKQMLGPYVWGTVLREK